uniref:(northern house mosquito) hypothetical protein n=1 Tax=Culex pipiens TaxID=7175 RepID=A0A8D8IAC6_CULPI
MTPCFSDRSRKFRGRVLTTFGLASIHFKISSSTSCSTNRCRETGPSMGDASIRRSSANKLSKSSNVLSNSTSTPSRSCLETQRTSPYRRRYCSRFDSVSSLSSAFRCFRRHDFCFENRSGVRPLYTFSLWP